MNKPLSNEFSDWYLSFSAYSDKTLWWIAYTIILVLIKKEILDRNDFETLKYMMTK